MRKKSTRATAAAMALVMLLTGCNNEGVNKGLIDLLQQEAGSSSGAGEPTSQNGQDSQDSQGELDYDLYMNSPITSVENEEVIYNQETATYTGDWKGDRPEGNGELRINENEYLKGEWQDGFLCGQGEIQEYTDGIFLNYKGECYNNLPYGMGELVMTAEGELNSSIIKGNFNDENSLMYFNLDEDGRLVDIGKYVDGVSVSFLDNFEVTGMDYLPEHHRYDSQFMTTLGTMTVKSQKGEYFGEIDENGIPNGYGYLRATYDLTWSEGEQTMYLHILGKWTDGIYGGPVLYLENASGHYTDKVEGFFGYKTIDRKFTRGIKKVGVVNEELKFEEDRVFYSDFTHEPSLPGDGFSVENIIDPLNPDNYVLGEDGIYRTDYQIRKYSNPDGSHGFSRLRYTCQDDNFWHYRKEGDYCNYDKNDNVVDYGVYGSQGWESLVPKKETDTERERIILAGIAIGAIAVIGLVASTYSVSENKEIFYDSYLGSFRTSEERMRAELNDQRQHMEEYERLIEEAHELERQARLEEPGYKRKELLNRARQLKAEAEPHYRGLLTPETTVEDF